MLNMGMNLHRVSWKKWRVRMARGLLLTGMLLVVSSESMAQSGLAKVPLSAYNAIKWRFVGPNRAGRALAAAGIPGNPRIFYFGSVDGGVWKTDNAGLTWRQVFGDEPNSSIGALAIAPSDSNIIYVGTGEADMRSDMTYGDGMYKSTDAGKHWTRIGLYDSRHIGKIVIDPENPDVVLVAALGHGYGPSEERGVFRSVDGGKSWTKVLYKGPDVGAVDLSMDPRNPKIVFATLWNARRTAWSQYPPNEGPGSGIYKSEDEGKTWTKVSGKGLPDSRLGRIGISVDGQRVYALVEAGKQSGLYRSEDGGASWNLMSQDPNITTRMWYFGRVTADQANPDIVYIPNRSVMRSTDGGKTFTAIKGSPGGDDYHFAWIDPKNGERMILASDQGTAVSLDNGKTWSSWYNQPTGQIYHVTTDNQFPYRIYGAQQDNGTVSIASRSDYGEITFRDWYSIGAGESGYIAVDPNNPNIVYGGDTYGGIYRYDHRTGQVQNIAPVPVASWPMPPVYERKYRFTWTSPIVFDPIDKKSLYFGAQVLLRTRDGGHSWKAVSPDLTGMDRKIAKDSNAVSVANAAEKGYGVIYSVAPSPLKEGVIWAGTDDGLVWLTKDGGQHWKNITPKGLAPWSKISIIDASHLNAQTAYIAVDRHRLDDFKPYIYRTHDDGAHWTLITDGIPDGAFVRTVRADPVKKGLLYAGTETGAYVSFDDGGHWQALQMNLPVASVRDLTIHGNDLIAATHGRAIWVLDDIATLREMSSESINATVHLYKPAMAYRLRRDESNDTPFPPEIPHGSNPPAGAIIDYSFKTAPKGPVMLEIRDSDGNLVRQFSSKEKFNHKDASSYFADQWLPRSHPLRTHEGLNRFVWDLRYTRPKALSYDYSIAAIAGKGTVKVPRGPLALPGTYKVTLIAGGKSYSQTVQIKMDPRVSVEPGVLKDQLRLALDIDHDMKLSMKIYNEIMAFEKGQKSGISTDVMKKASKISSNISIMNGSLSTLASGVQAADMAPTEAQSEAFVKLHQNLQELVNQWDGLKSTAH